MVSRELHVLDGVLLLELHGLEHRISKMLVLAAMLRASMTDADVTAAPTQSSPVSSSHNEAALHFEPPVVIALGVLVVGGGGRASILLEDCVRGGLQK